MLLSLNTCGSTASVALGLAETNEMKILATAEQLDPSLKANIALLLTKAEAIASASTAVAAGDGVNFAADATAVADIGAFFTFVKATIVPELETAYAAIKTDVA